MSLNIKSLVCLLQHGEVRFGVITKILTTESLDGDSEDFIVMINDGENGKEVTVKEESLCDARWSTDISKFAMTSPDYLFADKFKNSLEKPAPIPQPEAVVVPDKLTESDMV
jgi:hypothetical protein